MKLLVALLSAGVGLSIAASAAAADTADETNYQPGAVRRSDFTAGISLGLVAASTYGYPNEAGKLDNPAYVADTGVGLGSASAIWLGGALRDWFSFGLGITSLAYKAKGLDAQAGGFIVRIETFPFFDVADFGQDLGLYGMFGLGGMTLKEGDETRADGGALSLVTVGALWEPVRFGSFNFGPSLDYTHLFSQTLESQYVTLSARLVFYGGP
ncbi:MAG: hypothetical protein KC776_04000 [Myxococcales bacterium]|nr:hypothetical protein [Myxococcales bacterium]MCB9580159.1 hypothetical protein [Polyangiaceae bacterium]